MLAWLLVAALTLGAPDAAAPAAPDAAVRTNAATAPGDCPEGGVCAVAPAPAAIRLFVTLAGTTEDGCSQSTALSHETATLLLEVDGADDASLYLERARRSVTGPSLGEYRRGARDVSTYVHKDTSMWVGRARREADGLVLTFTRRLVAEVRFLGPGDLPLPDPREIAVDLRVACRLRELPVRPPLADRDAPPPAVPAPVLVCAGLEVLDEGLGPYAGVGAPEGAAAAGIPFGRGAGLRIDYSRFFWDESRVVRRTATAP
jgi:hypothetical protein